MLKRIALVLVLLCPSLAWAADSTVSALTAASALSGPELFYCVQGAADRKCTATQLQTFTFSTNGTGVTTALGVNVGSAGAFVVNGGALGTPSSGVATNLTGTASGLTAGSVTTNANLTGPITSVGNTTAIAAQTGTGSTFVVNTSPTLVTPIIGVAAGTSLALGGGSIGSDALEVTGTSTHNGNLSVVSGSLITSGNLSAAAWTTNGVRNKMAAASYTDTSSSGTVAAAYTDLFGTSTVLASSATTYTQYYGAYFVAPVASTNVTMTNKTALGADSISIGGASQGAFALAITGTLNASGAISTASSVTAGATLSYSFSGRGISTSPAAGSWQFGNTDVDTNASIVAQTLRSQGALAGGTSDQAGKNWTFIASPGKGTGAGGSFIFQTTPAGSTGTVVGTPTTALTIDSAQLATFSGAVTIQGTSSLVLTRNSNSSGWQLTNGAGSSTVPTIVPNRSDATTGIGAQASGNISLISAATEIARVVSTSLNVIVATDASASSGSGSLQVAGGASVAKRFWIPAITTSSGLQTAVLCQSSGGEMIADSVACLASGSQFKNLIGPMEDGALDKIVKLPLSRWTYKAEGNFVSDSWVRERVGPMAQDVAAIDSRLVGYDPDGSVSKYSTEQLLAYVIKAVQELNAKVAAGR